MSSPSAFTPGFHYGSLENCITRLETNAPCYRKLLEYGISIPPQLEITVFEDCAEVFYPPDQDYVGPMDVDHIPDLNFRQRATKLLPLVQ